MGSGYKTQYFTVVFDFSESDTKAEAKKKFLDHLKSELRGGNDRTSFRMPYTMENMNRLDYSIQRGAGVGGNFKNLGKSATQSLKNDIIDKYLCDGQLWYGLVKAFQFPGNKVAETDDVYKDRSFIKEVEKGVLGCDIINDRFGISYDFWRMYLKSMRGTEILYPSQYEFNVTFSTVLEFKNPIELRNTQVRTYTFENCYLRDLDDLGYDMTDKKPHEFKLGIQFNGKYKEKLEKLSDNPVFNQQFIGGLYGGLALKGVSAAFGGSFKSDKPFTGVGQDLKKAGQALKNF